MASRAQDQICGIRMAHASRQFRSAMVDAIKRLPASCDDNRA